VVYLRLALQSKIDRGLVLGLAAADLLVRGGERAGLLGLTPRSRLDTSLNVSRKLLAQETTAGYVPESYQRE